jgi:ubiquinol-cytochrome c reductase iron-sulfur subunit
VDLSKIEPGQMATFFWRKQPIYVVKRTPEMVASLKSHNDSLKDPESKESDQPAYTKNEDRSLKPEVLVLIGTCTHLGCLPKTRFTPNDATVMANWPGGFFCPCHGSKFDLAGRVFNGSPASLNLRIPPYSFKGDNTLVIGQDAGNAEKGAA